MNFRTLKSLAPALAAAFVIGAAAVPASAAPVRKTAFDGAAAHVTLVDRRDGHWRGHDRNRHWRGRDLDRRAWRDHYRQHYRPYRPPRYVYAPPAYYYPYDGYRYGYPSSGYFSFSSPNLGLSFGY